MEVKHSSAAGGSLQIASEVIEKIARLAAMEVEGVFAVNAGNQGVRGLLQKITPQNPIFVEMKNDVADVTVCLVAEYGAKIPELSEKVQKNVKASVQNMTQITVAKVNVVVTGVALSEAPVAEEATE